MKKLSLTFLLAIFAATTSWCDTGTYEGKNRSEVTTTTKKSESRKHYTFEEKNTLFGEHETTFDVFGSYTLTEDNDGPYTDGFGGGIGLNHFFNRFVGLGLDGYFWEGDKTDEDGVVSTASGSVIFRWPLDQFHIAPYIFGGGGGHFSKSDDRTSLHGGIGVEYRLSPHMGFFVDGRYVAVDDANNFGLPRVGLRFAF